MENVDQDAAVLIKQASAYATRRQKLATRIVDEGAATLHQTRRDLALLAIIAEAQRQLLAHADGIFPNDVAGKAYGRTVMREAIRGMSKANVQAHGPAP